MKRLALGSLLLAASCTSEIKEPTAIVVSVTAEAEVTALLSLLRVKTYAVGTDGADAWDSQDVLLAKGVPAPNEGHLPCHSVCGRGRRGAR
jgi:hypothetical protein